MKNNDKKVVITDQAPAAIGPYSVGIIGGGFLFTAGQLGIDPQTGNLVEGGIEAQTRQALKNLSAILQASGTSLQNVVKTTVFLQDMKDFALMNAVYGEFFVDQPPARSAIQVAALPKNGMVEIEAVAMI